VNLVKCQPPQEPAVAVTAVQIADLGPPTIHNLHATGRIEDNVAVRQVGAFVIGDAQAAGQLPNSAGLQVHFVQVIIVLAIRFFPRKQHAAAVIRNVRIANHTAGIVDQRFDPHVFAVPMCQAKRRAGHEMTLGLSVRLAFGIGVVRAAHRIVLGEHKLRHALRQRPQTFRPPQPAGVGVQVQPGGIVGGSGTLDQCFQAGRMEFSRRA
jgi:hypothetical protein